MTQQTPDLETTLRVTKTIAAPRDLVFKAWTEPERLKQWWGVEANFSAPIAEVDLRVGGKYRLGMLAPGGKCSLRCGRGLPGSAASRKAGIHLEMGAFGWQRSRLHAWLPRNARHRGVFG